MKTKAQLAGELETLQGWKSIRPFNLLTIFFTKKNWKRYVNGDWKGIADSLVLRIEEHENFHYAVIVFSTKGSIPKDTFDTLKERVNEFPLNSIRYESHGDCGFYPMVSDEGEYYMDDYELHRVAEDYEGVYVTAFAVADKSKLDCPWIIYTHFEKMLYIYHVGARFL